MKTMLENLTGSKLLDQKQVADILCTTVSTLNSMRYAGKLKDLPYVRFGNRIRYTLTDVYNYINNHKEGVSNA